MYADYLVTDSLPTHLRAFLEACAHNGVPIAIPETTLFEFQHAQEKLARDERSKIEGAYAMFERRGIPFHKVDPETVAQVPELMSLVGRTGVECSIARPQLTDYRQAHFRACSHESPVPPDSESDEMRDLVIWFLALRLAKEHNGAILLSRDKVHTHQRGDQEAGAANLTRFKSVDQALEFIGSRSPVGTEVRDILACVWGALAEQGFPNIDLPDRFAILSSRFVQGESGPDLVEASVRLISDRYGRVEFSIHAAFRHGALSRVMVSNVTVSKCSVNLPPISVNCPDEFKRGVETDERDDVRSRLAALRAVLGGSDELDDG